MNPMLQTQKYPPVAVESITHVPPLRQGEELHAVWLQRYSPTTPVVMVVCPVILDIANCSKRKAAIQGVGLLVQVESIL